MESPHIRLGDGPSSKVAYWLLMERIAAPHSADIIVKIVDPSFWAGGTIAYSDAGALEHTQGMAPYEGCAQSPVTRMKDRFFQKWDCAERQ